jgi:hypothetical protein
VDNSAENSRVAEFVFEPGAWLIGAGQRSLVAGEHTVTLDCWDVRLSFAHHYRVRLEERSEVPDRLFGLCWCRSPSQAPRSTKAPGISLGSLTSSAH